MGAESYESLTVTIGQDTLQVIRPSAPEAPSIVAAHPADAFEVLAAEMLASIAGAPVTCVNPRVVGGSSAGLPSVEQMADDLEALRVQLRLPAVVFWGMSGGGWLGLAWAHRHAHGVRALVLESVCACFRARLEDPACLLSPANPAWRSALETRGMLGAKASVGGATTWGEVEGVGSVLLDAEGAAVLVAPFPLPPRMRDIMPALLAFDARPWAGTIRQPTLVLAGEADPVAPTSHVRGLAERLGARFVEVPGGGHVPSMARSPSVIASVRAFLRESGVPAAP